MGARCPAPRPPRRRCARRPTPRPGGSPRSRAAALDQGAALDRIARAALHRHALPGEHRLVDRGAPRRRPAVGRNRCPGAPAPGRHGSSEPIVTSTSVAPREPRRGVRLERHQPRTASARCRRARRSRVFPSSMNVTIAPAASKYTGTCPCSPWGSRRGTKVTAADQAQAVRAPRAIRTFMSLVRWQERAPGEPEEAHPRPEHDDAREHELQCQRPVAPSAPGIAPCAMPSTSSGRVADAAIARSRTRLRRSSSSIRSRCSAWLVIPTAPTDGPAGVLGTE
jgi:hypothetical protein